MNDYFDKVYVLSLRREHKRRDLLTKRLEEIGLNFEFFDASDGSVFNSLWKKLDNDFFTTANYLACQISHLSIYADALLNNYKRILILEDDAIPRKDINELFDSIKNQIPEYYDILYLGYIPLSDDKSSWDYSVIENRFISNNIFDSKNLWGLYAYSISEKMMKYMIDVYKDNMPMEIDRFYVENHKEYYGIVPQLFCHDINISANAGLIDYSSWRKSIHFNYSLSDYLLYDS
jgi:glycosyl transferase family 25